MTRRAHWTATLLFLCATAAPSSWAFKLKLTEATELPTEVARKPFAAKVLEKTGKPVHEAMLFESLGCREGSSNCATGLEHAGITYATLLRGLRWPDNPAFYVNTGNLPTYCLTRVKNARGVIIKPGETRGLPHNRAIICWVLTMAAGDRAAKEVDLQRGKRRNSRFALPLRSHYADMQFMHGMAPNGQSPSRTFELIRAWAKLTYEVAAGQHMTTELVKDVIAADAAMAPLKNYFPAWWRVAELFDFTEPDTADARGVALGGLLHMVQDSFAECHTSRTVYKGQPYVQQYLTFYGQDAAAHARADDGYTPFAGIDGPVKYGARLIQALKEGHGFSEVSPIITELFQPAPGALAAGPGAHCQRETS